MSLHNTVSDRIFSDADWADAGQTFAAHMGFAAHPWVMAPHGKDHVHLVVSRANDLGEVWHGRHDRRNAQRACTALETEYGLTTAPRRRLRAAKQSVHTEREHFRAQAIQLAEHLAQEVARSQEVQRIRQAMYPHPPGSRITQSEAPPAQSGGRTLPTPPKQGSRPRVRTVEHCGGLL